METVQGVDGKVKIIVDSNRLAAYLEITPPEENGNPVSFDEVKSRIADLGINSGIDEAAIEDAVKKQIIYEKILFAQGQEPTLGTNASLEYKFPTPKERLAPKTDDKGNVDYHDLGLIFSVRKGQQLAIKIPPKPGEDGFDVYGNTLLAKPVKDIVLPKGKNVVADQEELMLYAAIDGNVTIVSGKVSVDPVFELKGNVDFSSGNINFVGNVVVHGMVCAGFKVHAEGDIEVRGLIENAEVVAQGNIQVKGGITGSSSFIQAGGDIQAKFVENARVIAGQNIFIKEAIIQSQIKAGVCVKVSDKRALIVGGMIQAFKEIESKVIGSQLATQTVLEVGINPLSREEYQNLMRKQETIKKELETISQSISSFQQSGRSLESLTDNKKLVLIKQLDDFKNYRQQLSEIETRITALEEEFLEGESSRINAIEVVYPGVRIVIGKSIYIVNDPIKSSSFVLNDGEVRIGSLR